MTEINNGHPGCLGVRMLPADSAREPFWSTVFLDLFKELGKAVTQKDKEMELGS